MYVCRLLFIKRLKEGRKEGVFIYLFMVFMVSQLCFE